VDSPVQRTLPEIGDRPRVLFLLSHSTAGGAQEIWANLAGAFERRGYDAVLAALYPPVDATPQPPIGNKDWLYVLDRKPASVLGGFRLFRRLVRFIRRHEPDVVFTALPAAAVMAPIAAALAGRRVRVVISHHSPVQSYSTALNWLDGATSRLPSVDAIVAVSETVRDSLKHRPPRYQSKLQVIHNALPPDIEVRIADLAEARRARPARREIVAMGRLAPEKNCATLLRAIANVPDASLTLVGTGTEEQNLKALARTLGIEGRVRFAGFMRRFEALAILADSDVFVQPSLFEGHSLALIEAARLGMPIIVSNVPSQVEGVTAPDGRLSGVLVDPHDPAALAAELRRMLDEPAHRQAWTERSRRLGENATFDKTFSAYEALARR
jgi:glycosyltransferase involved in cell wall biosynthesis